MIAIDQLRSDGWCHMTSPNLTQLHKFAAMIGLAPSSFHRGRIDGIPHYDLRAKSRVKAIAYGAADVSSKTLVAYYRTSDPELIVEYYKANHSADQVEAIVGKLSDEFPDSYKIGSR